MNPLIDPPTPIERAAGIRVGALDIALPDGFDRLGAVTNPEFGILSAPEFDPVMVAFVWVRIEDGLGLSYTFSDIRLVRDPAGWRLAMPSETKRPKCEHQNGNRRCGGRNHPRSNYCNWCGGPLRPQPESKYYEFVRCGNDASYRLLLDAVLAAYCEAYQERQDARRGVTREAASIR